MTTQHFPLTGPINLQARVGRGTLIVHLRDDLAQSTVSLLARDEGSDILDRVVVELRGPTLFVTAPRQGGIFDLFGGGHPRDRDAVDITVTIPTGTAIKVSSVFSDVTIEGRSGSVDIAAGAADIVIGDVDGEARLRYGSGSCHLDSVAGSVEVRSGSGDAHIGAVGGSLTSACGSGRLEVASVRGDVRTRAGSGSASLGAVFGDVDLASGAGPLEIGLPAGQSARLDVRTGSGRVNSELPVDDAHTSSGKAITVRARTGSGDIRLFRAA